MKKRSLYCLLLCLMLLLAGCTQSEKPAQVVAMTRPVYDFTTALCSGTPIRVTRLVTESLSCLHDYSLQVKQMRTIEGCQLVILSGAGLEDALMGALQAAPALLDASAGIRLLCPETGHDHDHDHHDHHHSHDPHIWLSITNARIMAENICQGLTAQYPAYGAVFAENLSALQQRLDQLSAYAEEQLSGLSCRELITFHDGFAYMAQEFDLTILHAIEEESGSEASAAELKDIITLVTDHGVPAIFTEVNGSVSAAQVISAETGVKAYALNMGMSELDYFETMYYNIDTLKEALE